MISKGLISIGESLNTEYEINNLPEGALVSYLDDEIRILCAADTEWTFQNVGPIGNANMNYCALKIYAPSEDIVSFKEGEQGAVEDEMFFFENNDFAGVDAAGRKYSIVWLPLASYDTETDSWTYFGSKSTEEKRIGWEYVVEWYDIDGKVIASDSINIKLTNENCFN